MTTTTTTPDTKARLKGVKIVELYKAVWNKWDQCILFVGLILFSWAINFETSMRFSLDQNVTSIFETNSLISLRPIVLYILQTALLHIYSKLSDMYSRAQYYTFALVFYIISNIVMATASNYNTLVGGQVIYAFGYTGANTLGPITIADLTNAVDRGLMQGLYNIPASTVMMPVGGSIADSTGLNMAGTIWNSMISSRLAKYVPGEYNYAKIMGSILYAVSLPTDHYNGVVEAYGSIQKILSIIAICITVLTFCFIIHIKFLVSKAIVPMKIKMMKLQGQKLRIERKTKENKFQSHDQQEASKIPYKE